MQTFYEMKNKVADLLSVHLDYDFQIVEKDEICASLKDGKAVICGKQPTDFYRALMLFSLEIKAGKTTFEISEKRHFDTLGFSLDLSRNGVIKVSKIKEIIDCMALLGFNLLKLYMEDTFDLPGYPHFGYRRGKYSHEELKEIDAYAASMGIEAVPAIQTLGHMEQYFRYKESADFRENHRVLLCGEEKTYDFIEGMIKVMRDCFRTKKLVINCDEAAGIGITQMMQEKKYVRPYDIVIPHVERVRQICEKYDFRPMVHGDLFYGHLGKGYYDFSFQPNAEDVARIPDVDVILWDYYHTGYEDYETLLQGHRSLGKHILFMGGIWTWQGQLPQVDFTFQTMCPAMRCCLKNGVKDVWAASFGDDGNEVNIALALPHLLIFSEHCFKGEACTEEWVYDLSQRLFQLDMDAFRALSNYHYPWVEGLTRAEYVHPNFMGKKILYTDILYNMTNTYDFSDILPKHEAALLKIKDAGKGTAWETYFDYARRIYEITIQKMKLLPSLKNAYQDNDRETLKNMTEEAIPSLIARFEELLAVHEKQWHNTYKPFGWEELNVRYAGAIARLHYAKRLICRYLTGAVKSIPELEYEFIEDRKGPYGYGGVSFYADLKSTGL